MNQLKEIFSGKLQQFAMFGALLAIMLFFQWASGGKVLEAQNLMNVIRGNAYILVLATGMVMVIIAGHIDLSVGSVAAAVGIIVAIVTTNWGLPAWVGLIIGLLTGLVIGIWQGFWVASWGIPAFIVTLAGMMIFRGANQWIGHSLTIPVPELFRYLGAGYLPDIMPDVIPFNLPTIILAVVAVVVFTYFQMSSYRKDRADGLAVRLWLVLTRVAIVDAMILGLGWVFARGREGTSFPVPGVVLVVLVLFYAFLTKRTVLGRSIYAVGGNKHAAELTGVRVKWTNFFVICNMAVLAAIAAMLFVGRANASGPSDGNMWELDAIAAVFIGGAAVSGGIGTVGATMVGGLVMAFLNNGLQLVGMGADKTLVIKGMVLLLAVAVDVYSKQQGKRSIIGTFMNARKNQAKIAAGEKAEVMTPAAEAKTSQEAAQSVPETADGATPDKK